MIKIWKTISTVCKNIPTNNIKDFISSELLISLSTYSIYRQQIEKSIWTCHIFPIKNNILIAFNQNNVELIHFIVQNYPDFINLIREKLEIKYINFTASGIDKNFII